MRSTCAKRDGSGSTDLHAAYVEFKRSEWEDFHNTVSQWEWERYLTLYQPRSLSGSSRLPKR